MEKGRPKNSPDLSPPTVVKDIPISSTEAKVEDKKLGDKKKNGSGSNNTLNGIGAIHGDNSIKDSFSKLKSFKVEVEDKKQEDKKNESRSNNSLSGIGAIGGGNTVERSMNDLETFEVKRKP